MKIKCLMVGAPGSGKGTQAAFIAERLGVPIVSTSSVIRASLKDDSPAARALKELMAKGGLIDDVLMWQLLCDRVAQDDCADGFILDGFPRTQAQLDLMLAHGVYIDTLLVIDVADEAIMRRLVGRRVHQASGRTYHVEFNPPKIAGVDDVTGESLMQREDDKAEVIVARLQTYHEQTTPILTWAEAGDASLKTMKIIDGMQEVAAVKRDVLACF